MCNYETHQLLWWEQKQRLMSTKKTMFVQNNTQPKIIIIK